jgi:enamine deaminase RidA (YjgF/YER057c/UK114 family)
MRKLIVFGCLFSSLAFADRKVVQPKEFPTGRPFSPAVWAGDTLYVAGQIGSDWKTGKVPEKFEDEVKQCLENIGIILKEAGLSYGRCRHGERLSHKHVLLSSAEFGLHDVFQRSSPRPNYSRRRRPGRRSTHRDYGDCV